MERCRRRPTRVACSISYLVFVLLSFNSRALAQSDRVPAQGQRPALAGVVRDSADGVIPRATIVAAAEGSSLTRVLDTVADGTFSAGQLPPGRYIVTASAPGFAPGSTVVDVPAGAPVILTLAPAAIVEQVTVVSASRQEELRETLNTRVDVISRSRIDETGGHETVAELLRELPGVVTRRGSETAGAAGHQIQGIDSRQVLVLVDGQPIVGARGVKRGGLLNMDRQSAARLERVEVVKGAASALYGSDALGGVINLITRQPSSPLDAAVSLAGGSFGNLSARMDAGFKRDRTLGLFSLERHQHDGFDLTPGTFDTTGAPYRRYDALGKVQRQLFPSLSLGAVVTGYANHTRGRSNGELGPQEDDIRDRALSAHVTGRWNRGTASVEARAYLSAYRERSDGRLAPPRSTVLETGRIEERFAKGDLTLTRPVGTRQLIQGGVEWSSDRYEGANRLRDAEGHAASTAIAWGQHRWSATSRLSTTIGARVDRRSRFETAISPKIAAGYRLTSGLTARASYGRGFRAPDLGQLYYRFLSPANFYQVIGNPELRPEHATSWQFGGEYVTPQRRARAGVNVFRNDVRDLIDSVNLGFVATPAQLAQVIAREGLDSSFRPVLGRPLLTYRNVAGAVTQGVEAEMEAVLTDALSAGGAYTYLSARDARSDLALTGRHPHQGHARVSWQPAASGFRASIRGTFYSPWIAARAAVPGGGVRDTVSPRFAVWDAFFSQRIGRRLSAFLTIDNLADSQDPNTGVLLSTGAPAPIYRPEAGRAARVGVQWSFSAR